MLKLAELLWEFRIYQEFAGLRNAPLSDNWKMENRPKYCYYKQKIVKSNPYLENRRLYFNPVSNLPSGSCTKEKFCLCGTKAEVTPTTNYVSVSEVNNCEWITSKEECEAAAKELGLSDITANTGLEFPRGIS